MSKRIILLISIFAIILISLLLVTINLETIKERLGLSKDKTSNTGGSISSIPTIIFPSIKSKEVLSLKRENMAFEMKTFVPDDAEELLVNKLSYETNNPQDLGFEITYNLKGVDIKGFYQSQLNLAERNGWKILANNISDPLAFIELERMTGNTKYQIYFSIIDKNGYLGLKLQYLLTH